LAQIKDFIGDGGIFIRYFSALLPNVLKMG